MREDEIKAVASANECTGAVPAIPADGNTGEARKLVGAQPARRRVFHRAKD